MADEDIGSQLFVKLNGDNKKNDFKSKCALLGLSMSEVIDKAVNEFLKKGKESCFLTTKK